MKNKYFKLFANCIPVKGSEESHIYDLENNTFFPIPNLLLEILEKKEQHNFSLIELKSAYNHQYNDGIDAFFDKFVEKGIGFFSTEPNLYPTLNKNWSSPQIISNAIIQITKDSNYDLENVLKQLENLGCRAIEFRINDTDCSKLFHVLSKFQKSRFQSYTFLINYTNFGRINECINQFTLLKRLSYIHFFAVPKKDIQQFSKEYNLFYSTQDMINYERKTMKSQMKITINIEIFMEAQLHNVGLNKKISIDENGNIKNYITHNTIYGNVSNDKIIDIVTTEKFRKKWYLSNDKIDTCKSCQYRYICVDNSDILYINNHFIKKEKCGFNPFLNKWQSI